MCLLSVGALLTVKKYVLKMYASVERSKMCMCISVVFFLVQMLSHHLDIRFEMASLMLDSFHMCMEILEILEKSLLSTPHYLEQKIISY